jgi:Uma2 family endonuclease
MIEYTHAETETLSTANETAVQYGAKRTWTFEEYMAAEELSVEKHEFHNGKRITMAGASKPHSIINISVGAAIINALNSIEDEDTEVCSNDLKVFIPSINKAVYPDLTVVQGEAIMKHKHVIKNPTLLVEVLSESTEVYDRGDKFEHYKTLPSFKEYVLVAQNSPLVEVFYRENPDHKEWLHTRYEGLAANVALRSIGCTLKMKDIYRRIFK